MVTFSSLKSLNIFYISIDIFANADSRLGMIWMILLIMLFIIDTSAGGFRPFVATGAEGLKQPSKGSPPLNIIMVEYNFS